MCTCMFIIQLLSVHLWVSFMFRFSCPMYVCCDDLIYMHSLTSLIKVTFKVIRLMIRLKFCLISWRIGTI